MLESVGDDSVVFNQDNIHKIITITKDRVSIDKEPENLVIINKGKNKIHLNLENRNQKINREEIMKSLKKIKKIEIENLDNVDNINNIKRNISPYKSKKNSDTNLIQTLQKDNIKNNLNKHIKFDIYDNNLDCMQFNNMKNKLKQKEKEEIINSNYNTFNISELYDNNNYFYTKKITDRNDSNKISERISLKSSNNNNYNTNLNSEYDYYNKNNYSDIKKVTNENLEKKLNLNLNKKELTRNKTLNLEKRNSTILITSIVNMINTTKSVSDKTHISSPYEKCLICERNFSVINLCCSECNIHFFCRKCLKYYCRDLVEKGIKRMKCPITKCNYNIYEEFLKSILSEDYYKLLFKKSKSLKSEEITEINDITENKYQIFNKKIKQNCEEKYKNIRLYNNKHVIDVNSNINFYNVRKYKDEYCPNCHEPTLFCKIDGIFHKCLNCGFKICKYCNKEFTNTHLIINYPGHCKVYYRKSQEERIKTNSIFNYLIQLIYVISMFYITFAFCYLRIYKFFKEFLKIQKYENNVFLIILFGIKDIFNIVISIVFFLMIFPYIFVWTPFFPVIIALVDGN